MSRSRIDILTNDKQDENGNTPLMKALLGCRYNEAKKIIDALIEMNDVSYFSIQNNERKTALDIANELIEKNTKIFPEDFDDEYFPEERESELEQFIEDRDRGLTDGVFKPSQRLLEKEKATQAKLIAAYDVNYALLDDIVKTLETKMHEARQSISLPPRQQQLTMQSIQAPAPQQQQRHTRSYQHPSQRQPFTPPSRSQQKWGTTPHTRTNTQSRSTGWQNNHRQNTAPPRQR